MISNETSSIIRVKIRADGIFLLQENVHRWSLMADQSR